jgi:hypothetical protein
MASTLSKKKIKMRKILQKKILQKERTFSIQSSSKHQCSNCKEKVDIEEKVPISYLSTSVRQIFKSYINKFDICYKCAYIYYLISSCIYKGNAYRRKTSINKEHSEDTKFIISDEQRLNLCKKRQCDMTKIPFNFPGREDKITGIGL